MLPVSVPDARQLLERFLARERAGDPVDFESWVRDYPGHERMLRELYARGREEGEPATPTRTTAGDSFFFGEASSVQFPGERAPLGPADCVGEFLLIQKLGQGGMGEVWEAEQVLLRRRVALKLVLPGRVNQRNLELFAREARAGGRLTHPGIVAVYGFGNSNGLHWISMELVEGGWTLREFIREMRACTELPGDYYRRVAEFVAELADALQAAHDAGVIHRDLKPQNVLITNEDRPKLTDFGLARITDETAISQEGEFAGTCLYMSPEQVSAGGEPLDHRADIFSLGIVLYEMLALQRPFDGDTTHQVITKILIQDPIDLRRLRSRVPDDLAVICGKALEKNRSHRYQSMAELAAELRRYLNHEPIAAKPPSAVRRGQKWARRNPAKTASGAVAACAFFAISVLAVVAHSNARRADENAFEAQQIAERERETAAREKQTAARERQRADEVLRLSALQELDDLLTQADSLVPPHPDKIDAYYAWLRSAQRLVAELPEHRAIRDELRRVALPRTEEDRELSRWSFSDEHESERWWNAQLTKLIDGLEALEDPEHGLLGGGFSERYGWSISKRLAAAEELEYLFEAGVDFDARWTEAAPSIAETYGQAIPMQMGLVPIGRDPASGLWEFWHVLSGEEPMRNDAGALELREDTGVVLVLLPGGRFHMGAQAEDESKPNYDLRGVLGELPVHEVELTPFFLSKYEMTQGQWKRLTGWNRSRYGVDGYWESRWDWEAKGPSLLLPVTDVSHDECLTAMRRTGLALPTEAQWEYGTRAGTETAWWSGSDLESLAGVANVNDRYAHQNGSAHWIGHELSLEDGYTVQAPVGSFAANPFGLHDVHGNVWELCQDDHDSHFYSRSPLLDPVCKLADPDAVIARGGGFADVISTMRAAARKGFASSYRGARLGLRPARAIRW